MTLLEMWMATCKRVYGNSHTKKRYRVYMDDALWERLWNELAAESRVRCDADPFPKQAITFRNDVEFLPRSRRQHWPHEECYLPLAINHLEASL